MCVCMYVCNTVFRLLSRFNLVASLCRPIINKLRNLKIVFIWRNALIREVRNTDKVS